MVPTGSSLVSVLVLAVAVVAAAGSAVAAPVFSETELSFDAISPNNDGIQELTEIRYTIAVDSADVRVTLAEANGGPVLEILQLFTRQGGTHTRPFDGVIGTGALADGDYEVQILGTGTQGEGTESVTLPLTIDRVAPVIASLDLVSPEFPVLMNAQRVTLQACVDGEPQTVSADFSALDSEFDAQAVTETPVGQSCWRFSYTITGANTLPDEDDLPVVVTARDRAGNAVQSAFRLCLSNFPPTIVETVLLNQFTVLQNGDQILVEVEVSAVNAVTVGADLSDLDSDFDPEEVEVTPLGGNRFRLAYTLSPGNIRPDTTYALRILAYDLTGCGIDEDQTLKVTLDNRGVLPALIDDVVFDVRAISPADGNGVNDDLTISFTVIEDTVRVIASLTYLRAGDERAQTLPLFSQDFLNGPQTMEWDGSFPLPFEEIPDQILPVTLRAISAAKDRQRDVRLELELDHTPPQFLEFRPPNPAQVENGERVDFSVVLDRPLYSLSPDFSAIDSEHAGRSVAVVDSGNGAYGISYVVSDVNTVPDGSNKIVPITAGDLAGNTSTDEGFVRLCLSNQPPRLVSAELVDNPGPFSNSEEIAIRTVWVEGRWTTLKPLTVVADFSFVDSNFGERKDKVTVFDDETGPPGTAVWNILYRISSGNELEQSPPQGSAIWISATDHPDLGCGSTNTLALRVEFDSLVPFRPVIDDPPAVVRTPSIILTGAAEDADFVEIKRAGAAVDTFDVETTGRFSGEVTLVPGANLLSAVGLDRAGNVSKPSSPVEVFFVEGNLFEIPGPFRPGSEFFVALQDPASRVTVRVFNLEGIEVARIDDGPGDLFRIAWDGTDDSGNLASSGPYLAVVDVEGAEGLRDRFKRAFVFSRRGG